MKTSDAMSGSSLLSSNVLLLDSNSIDYPKIAGSIYSFLISWYQMTYSTLCFLGYNQLSLVEEREWVSGRWNRCWRSWIGNQNGNWCVRFDQGLRRDGRLLRGWWFFVLVGWFLVLRFVFWQVFVIVDRRRWFGHPIGKSWFCCHLRGL